MTPNPENQVKTLKTDLKSNYSDGLESILMIQFGMGSQRGVGMEGGVNFKCKIREEESKGSLSTIQIPGITDDDDDG